MCATIHARKPLPAPRPRPRLRRRRIVQAVAEDLVQRGAADVEERVEEGVAGAVDAALEDEAGARS